MKLLYKHKNKFLFSILFALQAFTQSFTPFVKFEKIKERRKKATVIIRIMKGDGYITKMSGFFADKKGHIITVQHGLEDFRKDLEKGILSIMIVNSDLEIMKNPRIIKCDNSKVKLDACILKVDLKKPIKNYFPLNDLRKIREGEEYTPNVGDHYNFYSFGHPSGEYYTEIKSRLVRHHVEIESKLQCSKFLASKQYNFNLTGLEVKVTSQKIYEGGHSGAPLFDRTGKLVGMYKGMMSKHNTNCIKTGEFAYIVVPAHYLKDFYFKYRES